MKAKYNGLIYNVNHGGELFIRNDEGFDSGSISLQIENNLPLPNYSYLNIWEANDSYLTISSSALLAMEILFDERDIRVIYIDIDLQDVTLPRNIIIFKSLLATNRLAIDNGKLVLITGIKQTETGIVLQPGRQRIVIGIFDTQFDFFVNGEKQATTSIGSPVTVLESDTIIMANAGANDSTLYDFRMRQLALTEEEMLQLSKGNYNPETVLPMTRTEFVYTDFNSITLIDNRGIEVNVSLSATGVTGKMVKEWNFFTQAPKAIWFDRIDGIYQHKLPLIELTDWLKTIMTPKIDLSNPLSGAVKFNTIKDMIDHTYNVAFPEHEGVNVGFAYTAELLAIIDNTDAFDKEIPDGNLFNTLLEIFRKINGRPKIVKIEQGQITLGYKPNSLVNNEIQFNDYDGYESFNPSQGYGAVGESRGLNVVNVSKNGNKNAYLYTEETPITMRSETLEINEGNMITEMFYPSEVIDQVIIYDMGDPSNIIDVTNYVVLESEWKILKSAGFSQGTTTKFKQNTVRYEKGGYSVFGWGEEYYRFLITNIRTWKEIIRSAQNLAGDPVDIPSTWENLAVIVNYKTRAPQALFRVAKQDITFVNRHSTLQTNQGGSIVDSKLLTETLHSDIQSSGNRIIQYTKDIDSIDDLYELNDLDTLTNSMIKLVKIVFYEKVYTSVYLLSRDYQSIIDSLDIKAKVRQYSIPDGTESLRYYEDYIEWNLEGIENSESSLSEAGIEAFMNTFGRPTSIVKKSIDNVEIVSDEIVDEDGIVRKLIIPVDADGTRDTLKFYFGFRDPTFAYGKKIKEVVGSDEVIIEQGIRYTDEQGFLDTVVLNYGKKYDTLNKNDLDQLPVVNSVKYTGDPLIEIGAITDYTENVPQPPRITIRTTENVSIFTKIEIDINKPTSFTKFVTFLSEDDVIVDYDLLTVKIQTVDNFDSGLTIGTFNYEIGVPLEVPINAQIKTIIVTARATGTNSTGERLTNVRNTSYDQEVIVISSGLKLALGIGDIWLQNHFIHNVFYKQVNTDVGEIIIGDEAMLNNMLVGGGTKTLSVFESERYDKTEKTFVKGIQKGNVSGLITFGTQSMQCLSVIANGNAWAIGDSDGKLLFAVNPPRDISGFPRPVRKTVSHNHVHYRTGLIRDF